MENHNKNCNTCRYLAREISVFAIHSPRKCMMGRNHEDILMFNTKCPDWKIAKNFTKTSPNKSYTFGIDYKENQNV